MKLLNRSLLFTSISVLAIVGVWAVVFYYNMINEVYDSIDDGLDNYKMLIIQKASRNDEILTKISFEESNYAIEQISRSAALQMYDVHSDTLMFMLFEDDLESVRMLTSAFEQNGNYYKINVIASMVEEDDLIETLFGAIVWLYVLLMLSIIIMNNLLLRRLWKPFYTILHQLDTFKLENNQELEEVSTSTTEFVALKTAANRLISHSLQAYSRQKQFMENASHELQTPLAVMTNKIELMLEGENLDADQAQSLAELLQQIGNLKLMNTSLMLLTKIENRQVDRDSEVNMATLVDACIAALEELADFKQISFKFEVSNTQLVRMDAALARILVINLLKNAMQHGTNGSIIEIELRDALLEVRNPSNGKALDARLFDRFYKNSTLSNSTGLGLSITMAICKLYGFNISYQHVGGKHCFCVKFG